MLSNQSLAISGSRSSARLDTLPNEILSLITRHLDSSASASLAQTSRRFAPLCDASTWRVLDLTAMPRFYTLQAEDESVPERPEPELYLEAVKWIITEVLQAGSRRRWGMVERVKLCAVVGTQHGLVQLLELVSSSVEDIHFQHADELLESTEGLYNDNPTLDLLLLDAKLAFPNLTHLRLDRGTICFVGALNHLCLASPNLVRLEADVQAQQGATWYRRGVPPSSQLTRSTKIKYLCLRYDRRDHDLDHPDHGDEDDALAAERVIRSLLLRSPQLEHFSLRYWGGEAQQELFPTVAETLQGLKHLRYVYWGDQVDQNGSLAGRNLSAQGIIFEAESLCIIFDHLAVGPHLEIVHYELRDEQSSRPFKNATPFPPSRLAALQVAQSMIPHFASQLRRNPKMRSISYGYLDYDNDSGFDVFADVARNHKHDTSYGKISSFLHGDQEVLHLRLRLSIAEVADRPKATGIVFDDLETRDTTLITYRSADGEERYKFYKRLPSLVVQYFTDYEGTRVPLEVIESMREVEGLSEDEWYQRGVQVGDAAWRVLTDWR